MSKTKKARPHHELAPQAGVTMTGSPMALLNRIAPLLVIVGAALIGMNAWFYWHFSWNHGLMDAGVFRDAGFAITHGHPLYSDEFPTRSGFRFLYPPFAAVLFAPLMLVGERVQDMAWTVGTITAVFATVGMCAHRLGLRPWWMWAVACAGFSVILEPLRSHLDYGQINIFLVALVVADVLGYIPRRFRGLGIGIAAGIKITPAGFGLIFLVRKDWASLARAFGTFLFTVLIGFIIRGHDAVYFWTEEFFGSDRAGAPGYPRNQALTGVFTRAGMDPDMAAKVMIPGFLIIAALCVWGAYRYEKAGHPVASYLLVTLGICLANPVAVTHHWSGIVVAWALVMAPVRRWLLLPLLFMLFAFYFRWYKIYPQVEHFDFDLRTWLEGNLEGISGVVMFICLLVLAARVNSREATAERAH
ncbi:glycosyltransferase 87 family protein [Corynebacterium resistens]